MNILAIVSILTATAIAASGDEPDRVPTRNEIGKTLPNRERMTIDDEFAGDLAGNTVFEANFSPGEDLNYDQWPDGWTRRRGPDYPHFVEMSIVRSADQASYFSIQLDGGAAAAFTPAIPVNRFHCYAVEVELRTRELKHDGCWVSVLFRNASGEKLEQRQSDVLRGTRPWTEIKWGLLIPPEGAADAIIGLHVKPLGDLQDLTGGADFRRLVLRRFQRLEIKTSAPFHLHLEGETIAASCRVTGDWTDNPQPATDNSAESAVWRLDWELLDVDGNRLQLERQPLDTAGVAEVEALVSPVGVPAIPKAQAGGIDVTAEWSPGQLPPGFYRLRVSLLHEKKPLARQETTLVVLARLPRPAGGNFCWTLPHARDRDRLSHLEPLLRQAGVQQIKLPLWLDPDDEIGLDHVAVQIQGLLARGIGVTGLIVDPPEALRKQLDWPQHVSAVDLLLKPAEAWYPNLAPTVARLALTVPRWQLGSDRERFLAEFGDLDERVAAVRNAAQLRGLQLQLGLGWDWLQPLPREEQAPWSYLVFSAAPPLTASALSDYLQRHQTAAGAREVVIEPLDLRSTTLERLVDFVRRLVICRTHALDAVVVPDPFHNQSGLCTPSGQPTEMFVPWRTTSFLLAGAKHLGNVTLPGGSYNAVFERDGSILMAVWNDRPTEEHLWLGDDVESIDIWGRRQSLAADPDGQRFHVGPVPMFLVNLDPIAARTRLSMRLNHDTLATNFGKTQFNVLSFESFFPKDASGHLKLRGPDRWRLAPRQLEARLAPGETFQGELTMRPPFNAEVGRQLLAIDLDFVTAEQRYRFRAYQELLVEAEGIHLTINTWLDEQGNLIVEQRLSQQHLGATPFQCQLIAPQRRIQGHMVRNLGTDPQIYRYMFPNGRDLLGQRLSLQVMEQGGRQRVMQQRFLAEP